MTAFLTAFALATATAVTLSLADSALRFASALQRMNANA